MVTFTLLVLNSGILMDIELRFLHGMPQAMHGSLSKKPPPNTWTRCYKQKHGQHKSCDIHNPKGVGHNCLHIHCNSKGYTFHM